LYCYVAAAFWHLLSFGINAVICILWRPTDAATQFAYSELDALDDWDEEGAALGGGGVAMGHVAGKGAPRGPPPTTDVFALDDEENEVGKME
jgi:hypothetical protein